MNGWHLLALAGAWLVLSIVTAWILCSVFRSADALTEQHQSTGERTAEASVASNPVSLSTHESALHHD